jgi:precorrin-3B synthase
VPVDEACPSVANVVPRVDGGLVRIRVPAGVLSSTQLRAVAAVARRFGNGVVELTNRANVQLRGVADDQVEALGQDLVRAGLSEGRVGDLRRNILANPLAGLDPDELVDVRPIVAAILAATADDPRLANLSPKFGVVVDGGGRSHLGDRHDDLVATAVRLADGSVAFDARTTPERWTDLVGGERDPSNVRLGRRVVGAEAVPSIVHAAMLRSLDAPGGRLGDGERPRLAAAGVAPLGAGVEHDPTMRWVGAMPMLGRTDATGIDALAAAADELSGGEVRLTPWRGVVLPHVPAARATAALEQLAALGFLVDPSDPATWLVACAGSVGCTSGLTDTQADARLLATQLRAAPVSSGRATIHVSGCDKRCAQRSPATVTLLASSPARYDVLVPDPTDAPTERTAATHLPPPQAIATALDLIVEGGTPEAAGGAEGGLPSPAGDGIPEVTGPAAGSAPAHDPAESTAR